MNKLDKQYTNLLQDILDNGVTKGDRTGTGTLSVFGRQIRHKMYHSTAEFGDGFESVDPYNFDVEYIKITRTNNHEIIERVKYGRTNN